MENGASSYLRFLNGDNDGFVDLVKEYNDGLILFLNSRICILPKKLLMILF